LILRNVLSLGAFSLSAVKGLCLLSGGI
jgi:hypothetical protein